MNFEHTISTRHPTNWLIAAVLTCLDMRITLLFAIGIIYDGLDFGPILALKVGLAFSATGLSGTGK